MAEVECERLIESQEPDSGLESNPRFRGKPRLRANRHPVLPASGPEE